MTTLIVIGIAVVLFVVFVVVPVCWLTSATHERWAEAYWSEILPPRTDDPQEWTGPMHTGGTGAGRRMTSHLRKIGYLPVKRTSEATRKVMAVLDARKPRRPGWMLRRSPKLRRPVWDDPAPVAEAPPEVHHEDEHLPVPATAPLAERGDPLPAAPVTEPSLIGDALAAEMGRVPEHVREGGSEDDVAVPSYSDDNTLWSTMKAELFDRRVLFAMLEQDDEVAS